MRPLPQGSYKTTSAAQKIQEIEVDKAGWKWNGLEIFDSLD
jgi:hypothetical protein